MKIKYERACMEAGLPEEKIQEIRRMFDADYKSMKRRKQAKKERKFVYYSLELLKAPEEDDVCYFDYPDPDMDLEQMMLHQLDLERLDEVLATIPEEERLFILDCFDKEWGAQKEIAEKYGMTPGAVKQKKHRIFKKIRQRFLEGDD